MKNIVVVNVYDQKKFLETMESATEDQDVRIHDGTVSIKDTKNASMVTICQHAEASLFGCTTVRTLGDAHVLLYSSSMVKIEESEPIIQAYDQSAVLSYAKSKIHLHGSSTAIANWKEVVTANDNSLVWANRASSVMAYDRATVYAYGGVTVYAYGHSTVYAYGMARVFAYTKSPIHLFDSSKIIKSSDGIDVIRHKKREIAL